MVRSLIGALLVCRLSLRQLPLEAALVLAAWRRRPAIEIVLEHRQSTTARRDWWRRRLDEVYPC